MILGITPTDLLVFWQKVCITIAWFVAVTYLLSGVQDFMYDVWNYGWEIYKRFHFAKRPRLTLERLRSREQQAIAVFIPAWQEYEVIEHMVENFLHRVTYSNYKIFIGTYPNDLATQQAVDRLSAAYPQVVKVVTSKPGPTNKADCMNHLYQALKVYEMKHETSFDIIVMHDAEDVVHPYSLLLYNYLIPRVDAIQLPILPLPVPLMKFVHWVYADEFAENHMMDVIVREKSGGFVPFAGVGTGFARRAFTILEEKSGGEIFNEQSLTEDYSLSKKMQEAGMKSIFVNVILADDTSPWYTPLCRRSGFIANWSYFPFDIFRSIRQKTRWIIGISLQDWEYNGWKGTLMQKENLLRDRKGFVAFTTALLGYLLFAYYIMVELGHHHIVPFQWEPIFFKGTALYELMIVDTCFMCNRFLNRLIVVTRVYGFPAALLALPRIFVANIINGIASFRALQIYLLTRKSGRRVKWDKTDHEEGVGSLPSADAIGPHGLATPAKLSCEDFSRLLDEGNQEKINQALDMLRIQADYCNCGEHAPMVENMRRMTTSENVYLRAMAARVALRCHCEALLPFTLELLKDREWIVRANAARALMAYPHFPEVVLSTILAAPDHYAREVFFRTIEQDTNNLETLFIFLQREEHSSLRALLFVHSPSLMERYEAWQKISGETISISY